MVSSVWGNEKTQFFNSLTPDVVLNDIDKLGYKTTGRILPLNSMENRVYEVEIDNPHAKHVSENFIILKVYRPGRWTLEQIQDEHDFLYDLIENDIQVIAPVKIEDRSLFVNQDGLYFCLFPKQGGRACVEWNDELLAQMGRLLARVHNTGLTKIASARLKLDIATFGRANLELILDSPYLLPDYKNNYNSICNELFDASLSFFEKVKFQRIHGDCHHGNILLNDGRPFLIDFDDMSMGPKVQDIWMITPGRDDYAKNQRDTLINSYLSMSDFDFNEIKLIEPLRALRIIHFSAWIAHRFEDSAFKNVFTNFGSRDYWEREIFNLRAQLDFINNNHHANYHYP